MVCPIISRSTSRRARVESTGEYQLSVERCSATDGSAICNAAAQTASDQREIASLVPTAFADLSELLVNPTSLTK
jgi:hypothetical protein